MDLGSPLSIASGLFLGLISMALFIYGKKNGDIPAIGASLILGGVPMLVHSLIVVWVIAIATFAGLYAIGRNS
jgi:hypothetical protein